MSLHHFCPCSPTGRGVSLRTRRLWVRIPLRAPKPIPCIMPRKRLSENDIRKAVKSNITVAGVMRDLGISNTWGGQHTAMSRRIKSLEIDTSHFLGQAHGRGNVSQNKRPAEQILVRGDRRIRASQLRRALIESGVEHACLLCGITGLWNGRSITLEIDHLDGDPTNNLFENLRFLCPNCHSQCTETNASNKNAKKHPNRCCDCGSEISKHPTLRCKKCAAIVNNQPRIDWPSKKDLAKMVADTNMSETARQLGVSGNAVKKRLKTH